ncbi:MAG: hypothetical protein ACOYMR_10770 [Ilumatobacteraceae bacterium]
MASSAGRAKRDREKARQEKQAMKRERKLAGPDTEVADEPTGPTRPQDQILADLASLHQRFDDEQISFDDFEDAKAGLLAELQLG